jgi:AbrB family looped-hinge helix DNA binding protein
MNSSTITAKGQTTIPIEIRRALGLQAHDRLLYEIRNGEVILHPMKANFFEFRGAVKAKGVPHELKKAREAARKFVAERGARRGR